MKPATLNQAEQDRFRAQLELTMTDDEFPPSSLFLRVLGVAYLGAGDGCEYESALEEAFYFQARGEAGDGDDDELADAILERLAMVPLPDSN